MLDTGVAADELNSWVQPIGVIIGTAVAVATLVLQLRQRKAEVRSDQARQEMETALQRESAAPAGTREEQEATEWRRVAEAAYRQHRPPRRRRSYKAIAAAVFAAIGLVSAMGALALAAADEPAQDAAVGALLYVVIAIALAFSARGDVRGDPGRKGGAAANASLAIGALAALGALTVLAQTPTTTSGITDGSVTPAATSAPTSAPTVNDAAPTAMPTTSETVNGGTDAKQTVPDEDAGTTASVPSTDQQVLDDYFNDRFARCQLGQTPETDCSVIFDAAAQQAWLQQHGYLACRQQGRSPDECVLLLPR